MTRSCFGGETQFKNIQTKHKNDRYGSINARVRRSRGYICLVVITVITNSGHKAGVGRQRLLRDSKDAKIRGQNAVH